MLLGRATQPSGPPPTRAAVAPPVLGRAQQEGAFVLLGQAEPPCRQWKNTNPNVYVVGNWGRRPRVGCGEPVPWCHSVGRDRHHQAHRVVLRESVVVVTSCSCSKRWLCSQRHCLESAGQVRVPRLPLPAPDTQPPCCLVQGKSVLSGNNCLVYFGAFEGKSRNCSLALCCPCHSQLQPLGSAGEPAPQQVPASSTPS